MTGFLAAGAPVAAPTTVPWLRHLTALDTGAAVDAPAIDRPLGDEDWDELRRHALVGRVTWSLLEVVRRGMLPATDDQHEAAATAHAQAMAYCLRLDRLLADVSRTLTAAGIDHRALKGAPVAHLDHAGPEQRQYGDVDLLVRGERIADALDALEATGVRRRLPTMGGGADAVLTKGATLVTADDLEVDLHRTIAPGAYAVAIATEPLWRGHDTVTVGDVEVQAFTADARALHTAAHLRLGNQAPYLSTARDLLVQADRRDPADVAALASETGLLAVLAAAVDLVTAEGLAPGGAWASWRAGVVVPDDERRRLERHIAGDGSFAALAREAVREVPWHRRPAALVSIVLPSSEHLAARSLTRREHLARLAGAVTSAGRRRRSR